MQGGALRLTPLHHCKGVTILEIPTFGGEQQLIEFGESRKVENAVNKVFSYQGTSVTFIHKDGKVMVNATEMAKKFGKRPAKWLELPSTEEFLNQLRAIRKSDRLVETVNGIGTWMHEDVAIEFARWLSPAFAIWCNDRIKELLTVGMTATQPTLEAMLDNPDLVIGLATKLKQQREENERLALENKQQANFVNEYGRYSKHEKRFQRAIRLSSTELTDLGTIHGEFL